MSVKTNRRRVLGAALLAAIAAVAWWKWSERMAVRADAPERAQEPFVQLANSGSSGAALLQERAELMDPTPMFLPTTHNAGQKGLPSQLVARPGQVFANFTARLNTPESSLPNYGADPTAVADTLTDVMARSNESPFAGLGERAGAVPRLAQRTGFVEVKALQGNRLIAEAVESTGVPRSDFAPMEFLANVSTAGLVGDPMLVASSGAEEVDSYFRDYLAKSARLGQRLAPGIYRVQIGP